MQRKVHLVTGASSGIGLAYTKLALQSGSAVFAIDLSLSEALKSLIGPALHFYQCDVSNAKQLHQAFQAAISTFGSIHVVLNNAGVGEGLQYVLYNASADYDKAVAHWDKLVAIDLNSVIYGTALGSRYLGTGGVLLNVASMAGLIPIKESPVYAAAKYGVVGLTRSVHHPLRSKGIRAYAVCPSFTDTPLVQRGMKSSGFANAVNEVAKRGLIQPEAVAKAMLEVVEKDPGNSDSKVVLRITHEKGVDFQSFRSAM